MMSGVDEDLDAVARRKKRRALDIEAGLTWAALFGGPADAVQLERNEGTQGRSGSLRT